MVLVHIFPLKRARMQRSDRVEIKIKESFGRAFCTVFDRVLSVRVPTMVIETSQSH